jgi:beta-glucosidase
LKGFERVTLAPHEKKTVRLQLGEKELRYWNSASKAWVVEPAKFDVWLGNDSEARFHPAFAIAQ